MKADRLVTRIDPGVVSLAAELRGHERQAVGELGQGKHRGEEHKPLDASPAAITLAMLLTDEEWESWEKRAGDGESAGRGRPGGSEVASPQPALERVDLGKMNLQLIANEKNQDRAQCGKNEAGGMIPFVCRARKHVGNGAADDRSDDAEHDRPEDRYVHVHHRSRDNPRD